MQKKGIIPYSQRILQDKTLEMQIERFVKSEIPQPAGIADVKVRPGKGGLGKSIWVFCENPAIAIGKDGWRVKKLEKNLRERFDLDKAKVSVKEMGNPDLNAEIVANRTAAAIERGVHVRRAGWSTVNRVMRAGALGVSVRISGKVYSTYSQSYRFADGKLIHSGHIAKKYVEEGKASALVKTGKIGVKVKIAKPPHLLSSSGQEERLSIKELGIKNKASVRGELERIKTQSKKLAEKTIKETRRGKK
ncbi:MAG: 30S ribosomal protein S3 [Candidatus Korarchaeota archaeon]|nr:30S ribosomal protein S3 [Candidatus Korarchaeota archaeon]NIU84451.1 30S ribosomal protein S3 [Candidatus Thorarchaeota archaeon]NIW12934.1 30S ribosomal protein S3 [Candidatus Thorarchaeota archaeon]NIW51898.1 30S ribosomal protein S3 [Candidatus Korarchaeota archaeon]